ncbi:MAG: hypothetical protein AAB426_09820, partial [Myxococcota bacterium]
AEGILAGYPQAQLAGITPVEMAADLSKAQPNYDSVADRFTYVPELLDEPLLKKWIDHFGAQGLPIDYITFHIWDPSAYPNEGAFWQRYGDTLEGWLVGAGFTAPGVTVLATDFANWQNVCIVDPSDALTSYYDSEYLAAMFIEHRLATLRYSIDALKASSTRLIQNFDLIYGYMLPFGALASCMTARAGFDGRPGIVNSAGIPKASYNALHLLTQLEGRLGFADSSDPMITAVSSYRGDGVSDRIAIMLARHIPSELHFVAEGGGFPGYQGGSLTKHNYGQELALFDPSTISSLMVGYLSQADFPRQFLRDLLAVPPVFDVADLGLPAGWTAYQQAVRDHGIAYRLERSRVATAELQITGVPPGSYVLTRYRVDADHGHGYPQRAELHQRLLDASAAGATALQAEVDSVRAEYGVSSTIVSSGPLQVSGTTASLSVDLAPNSVHVLVLSK